MNLLAWMLLLTIPHDDCRVTRCTTTEVRKQFMNACPETVNEIISEARPDESWKDIAGFEGLYQASDQGRVRSLDRRLLKSDGTTQLFHGCILKPCTHKDGYRLVNLQRQGVIKGMYVHVLVYAAFKGEIPSGLQVNHDDGNKGNCMASNLTAMTPSQNCQHRDNTGLRIFARGERSGLAKLSNETVLEIVSRLSHETDKDLARAYGIHHTSIHNIRSGKTWSHLTGIARGSAA